MDQNKFKRNSGINEIYSTRYKTIENGFCEIKKKVEILLINN